MNFNVFAVHNFVYVRLYWQIKAWWDSKNEFLNTGTFSWNNDWYAFPWLQTPLQIYSIMIKSWAPQAPPDPDVVVTNQGVHLKSLVDKQS